MKQAENVENKGEIQDRLTLFLRNKIPIQKLWEWDIGRKKNLPSSVLLLVWPGEVIRKREDDSGQTGPALFAGKNKTELGNFFFLPMSHRVNYIL